MNFHLVSIAPLLAASATFAVEFQVVAASGNDTASGSAAHPLKTISTAAHMAAPGDTVTVHALNPVRGKIKPPRMDQAVAQGMAFTDAHTTSSVCTPSRYSLPSHQGPGRSAAARRNPVISGVVRIQPYPPPRFP